MVRYLPGFAAVGAVRGFDVRGEDMPVPARPLTGDQTTPETHFSLRSAEPVLPINPIAAVLGRVMFFCRIAVFAAENGSCPEYSLLSRSTCSSAEICGKEPSQKVVRPPEMSLLP